jgi:hypothetical protein
LSNKNRSELEIFNIYKVILHHGINKEGKGQGGL